MADGFDILGANGLPMGLSTQLRLFFDLAQNELFVRQHNERLMRQWDKSRPDHPQIVYALFNVVIDGGGVQSPLKPFGSTSLHHQFWFQAEKELEYWAIKHLGARVSADFYVRHYAGTERWVKVERKTISFEIPAAPAKAVAKAANDPSQK